MKEKISTDEVAKADAIFSQAIVSNDFIFVAGQIHNTVDGAVIDGTVEEKVRQIIKNIEAILKAAGAGLDNIVKATVYVTDMSTLPEVNKIYPTFFSDPLPAREAVCI
jgi:2-iminobutanoate/2-iminopropanoate deaminase